MADMKELTGSTYFPAEGQSFRNYIEELLKAKPKFSGLFTQESPVKPISTQETPAQAAAQAPQSSSAPFGYNPDGTRATKPVLTPEQEAYFDWLEANPGMKDMRGAAMGGALGSIVGTVFPGAGLLQKIAGVDNAGGIGGLLDTEQYLWRQFQIDQARQASGQVYDAAARSMRSGYVPEAPGLFNPTQEQLQLAIQMANAVPQAPVPEPVPVPPPVYVAPAPVAVSSPVVPQSYESAYQAVTGGYSPMQSYTDSSGNTGTLSLSSYTPTYTGSSEGE